ncbi:hypothetical protein F2Q68_00009877 [Brassica cretica]|uniref:Uncharacterized protein n=1 Tax=Brassica cretica TaxID=69181 RepID=A0A8S9L0A5_BRACR|nr:hypothetical protein F2Q68_00009877 [Brassica cretica]
MEDFLELEEFLELKDGEQLRDLDSSREVTMEDFFELEERLEDMDQNSKKKLDDDQYTSTGSVSNLLGYVFLRQKQINFHKTIGNIIRNIHRITET